MHFTGFKYSYDNFFMMCDSLYSSFIYGDRFVVNPPVGRLLHLRPCGFRFRRLVRGQFNM